MTGHVRRCDRWQKCQEVYRKTGARCRCPGWTVSIADADEAARNAPIFQARQRDPEWLDAGVPSDGRLLDPPPGFSWPA